MSQRLLLIDGHSMAFRAFYALPVEKFSTAGGQHTNAVYGFLSMLANLLKEEQPTHLGVAFDVGRSTFRTEMFPDYKAQREAAPEAFRGQVALIQKVLQSMGITTMTKENYEADDIIATLVTATPEGFDTRIVTGDRDYYQLVNEAITVLYPRKGVSELDRFTPEAVEEKYGLTPEQYPDFAALRGDPSDNLPNIPGVGEKTAQKWIRQYGTLANLLDHAGEIKGKAGNNFRERLDQVRMNRELTQMVRDVPLDVTVEQLALAPVDVARVAEVFDELEFGAQLRGRVLSALPTSGELPEPEEELPRVTLSAEGVGWLRGRSGVAVAFDGEESLACVSQEREAVLLNLAELGPDEEKELERWLASDAAKYIHGAKEAARGLGERGFGLRGVEHDTLIAAYLLRPGQRTYALDEVYQRHAKRSLEDGLVHEATAVLELSAILVEQLQEIQGYELYADLELPLSGILGCMERAGVAVDTAALEDQLQGFVEQVEEEVAAARELAGDAELNLSSPKQLQVVLFDTLGLPKTKKTKTGYSTAAKEIEQLAVNHPHPFLDRLLAHREYQKLKTTLEGLIKAVGPDGRIHTTFNQTVASTGRLSSTDPNLQNIPVRTGGASHPLGLPGGRGV